MSQTTSAQRAHAKPVQPVKSSESSMPISRLHVPEYADLDAATQKYVDRDEGANWTRAMALSPNLLRRFMVYYTDILTPSKGKLPVHEREMLGVVVSVENGCGYCELNHTLGLTRATKDSVRARRIALDHHTVDLSERERALVDLAIAITRDPKSVHADDLQYLRDLGLADDEILEAIEVIAWFNHSNRLAIPLGIVPDAKFFE